jgi:hypothetical protein
LCIIFLGSTKGTASWCLVLPNFSCIKRGSDPTRRNPSSTPRWTPPLFLLAWFQCCYYPVNYTTNPFCCALFSCLFTLSTWTMCVESPI